MGLILDTSVIIAAGKENLSFKDFSRCGSQSFSSTKAIKTTRTIGVIPALAAGTTQNVKILLF